ncbi:beta-1,4-galactosyltransferase 2 [Tachysurus ichikawai]
MSRLMLGRTLERVCKAVLLLCLVHFLIMMILYFDVYSQRFDIFSRFNNGRGANASRWPHHSYYNYSGTRPNATFASYVPASEQLPPNGKPELNRTHTTPKSIPPCPEVPPGLGSTLDSLRILISLKAARLFIPRVKRRRESVSAFSSVPPVSAEMLSLFSHWNITNPGGCILELKLVVGEFRQHPEVWSPVT